MGPAVIRQRGLGAAADHALIDARTAGDMATATAARPEWNGPIDHA